MNSKINLKAETETQIRFQLSSYNSVESRKPQQN